MRSVDQKTPKPKHKLESKSCCVTYRFCYDPDASDYSHAAEDFGTIKISEPSLHFPEFQKYDSLERLHQSDFGFSFKVKKFIHQKSVKKSRRFFVFVEATNGSVWYTAIHLRICCRKTSIGFVDLALNQIKAKPWKPIFPSVGIICSFVSEHV